MKLSRRAFLGSAMTAAAGVALPGFCAPAGAKKAGAAVQLYSIREYIGGRRGKTPGVGLERALADLAKIGYKAVEFAGYYGKNAKALKKMLDDNGLVACGTHVGRGEFGPDKIKATCEFNLGYGNSLIICPGGGNFPGKGEKLDDFLKMLVDYYNKAAETAATFGCKIGLHNHTREFELKMKDGTTYWDYFFRNTSTNVCMEQDVGWTTCAGADPCAQYAKYPHRSPTLHAKENAGYLDESGHRRYAPVFEGILGQPAKFNDGRTVTPVNWDALFPVTDADGVAWYVVECEKNASNLKAVTESFKFLQSKGRC